MRANHQPEKGQEDLYAMYYSLGTDQVQVNFVTMEPDTQREQEFGVADIKELDQDEESEDPITDTSEEANVNTITVNKIPIGRACSPFEVIQAQTENGILPIVIIYDMGSDVSLCNFETGPIVVDTKRGNKKVTLITINSIQAKLRKIYKLKINYDWSLQADETLTITAGNT